MCVRFVSVEGGCESDLYPQRRDVRPICTGRRGGAEAHLREHEEAVDRRVACDKDDHDRGDDREGAGEQAARAGRQVQVYEPFAYHLAQGGVKTFNMFSFIIKSLERFT